jgi:hypothetical protein
MDKGDNIDDWQVKGIQQKNSCCCKQVRLIWSPFFTDVKYAHVKEVESKFDLRML